MVLWARLSSSIAFSVGCCPVRLCWSSDFWTPTKIADSPLGASWTWNPPANLSIWALERHHCPPRLSTSPPIVIRGQVCQPVWGSCSLWVIGILVRELNPPCVVCSGRSFKLWFLRTSQLHNWGLLGLLLFNVRVEIKESRFSCFVLFSEHFSCCLKGRVFWVQDRIRKS